MKQVFNYKLNSIYLKKIKFGQFRKYQMNE